MVKFDKPAQNLFCENCGELVKYEVITKKESYNIRGDEITIDADIPVCKNCGAELFDIYLEDNNLRKAYSLYAKMHGLVTPEEIKKIRKKYGLNQELFARILGISRPTLARYENGSLPSEAVSNLIKQANDPQFFLSLLENRKQNLSEVDYKRIEDKIKHDIVDDEIKTLEETFIKLNGGEIKLQKLYGVVAYILERLKKLYKYEYVTKVRLMKLLWFVDSKHSEAKVETLTGLTYAHLPLGPAPDCHDLLIDLLEEISIVDVRYDLGEDDSEIIKISLKDPSATRYLTEEEKDFIEEIIKQFGTMPTKNLIDISHNDVRWKSTQNGERINFFRCN